jgi:tyrosyl-tRNA synthetase
MLEIASYFTVSQLLERDMFQERIKNGKQIYLHEFLYPIFQAYDSATMGVDMEIGGNDQTFNMLAGRTFMKRYKNKEKFVLATKLLTDPTGKKMGKSEGNAIDLDEEPKEMFGKIMAWPDSLIFIGFELCTNAPMDKIKELETAVKAKGENPRDVKMQLAYEIVKTYYGEKKAAEAEVIFKARFSPSPSPSPEPEREGQGGLVEIKADYSLEKTAGEYPLVILLVEGNLASSKSEARRKIKEGAVEVNGVKVIDEKGSVAVIKGTLVRLGKRFLRIK